MTASIGTLQTFFPFEACQRDETQLPEAPWSSLKTNKKQNISHEHRNTNHQNAKTVTDHNSVDKIADVTSSLPYSFSPICWKQVYRLQTLFPSSSKNGARRWSISDTPNWYGRHLQVLFYFARAECCSTHWSHYLILGSNFHVLRGSCTKSRTSSFAEESPIELKIWNKVRPYHHPSCPLSGYSFLANSLLHIGLSSFSYARGPPWSIELEILQSRPPLGLSP